MTKKLKENLKLWSWLFRFGFRIDKVGYTFYVLLNSGAEITTVVISFAGAQIVDLLVSGTRTFDELLTFWLAVVFVAGAANALIYNFITYFGIKYTYNWDLHAWVKFIQKTATLDFQFRENPGYSVLMHKVKEAVSWRLRESMKTFAYLIANVVGLLMFGSIFFQINPLIILVVQFDVIIKHLISRKFGRIEYSFWDESGGDTAKHGWNAHYALEQDDVVKEARIYKFIDVILNRYRDSQNQFIKRNLAKFRVKNLAEFAVTFFQGIIYISIQIWLINQVFQGQITIGQYGFYVASMYSISRIFHSLESRLADLYESKPYFEDMKRYFELENKIVEMSDPVKVDQVAPQIEFRNVGFKYPETDNWIVKNLNFKIEAGEKLAIVGENGAGKTTLIKLLARFYDPTEGEILINGVNLKNLELESYYKLWGILFQSFAKLWFSVRENIGIGNIEDMANIDLIKQAAAKADATKFIEKLPVGYETLLSRDFENGRDLSGGQWQKLGIARSFFADPKLIVMDEPTSSLDALAEAEVFRNIAEISSKSTIITISHRFATVRNSDRIIVLENGQITENGSHEQLMQYDGLYKKMFSEQASGYL